MKVVVCAVSIQCLRCCRDRGRLRESSGWYDVARGLLMRHLWGSAFDVGVIRVVRTERD